MQKRIGDAILVKNKRRKFGADTHYISLRVQLAKGEEEGSEVNLLFTDTEFENARKRALENPEDCPKVSWLRDLID